MCIRDRFIPAKEILSNAWNLDAAVKMGNVEFDDTYLDIIAAAKIDKMCIRDRLLTELTTKRLFD